MKNSLALSSGAILLTMAALPEPVRAGTLIVAIQQGGEAAIITRRAFRNCAAGGNDAWNTERCTSWKPLGSGRSTRNGYYCVQAWWPGGRRFRQGLDMTLSVAQRELSIAPQPAAASKGFC